MPRLLCQNPDRVRCTSIQQYVVDRRHNTKSTVYAQSASNWISIVGQQERRGMEGYFICILKNTDTTVVTK